MPIVSVIAIGKLFHSLWSLDKNSAGSYAAVELLGMMMIIIIIIIKALQQCTD